MPFDRRCDWCSCVPDELWGVYLGRECWEHDRECERAAAERRWARRWVLYQIAHLSMLGRVLLRFAGVAAAEGSSWRMMLRVAQGVAAAVVCWGGLVVFNPWYRRARYLGALAKRRLELRARAKRGAGR